MTYNPQESEKKWQKYWEENTTFKTPNPGDADFDETKPKYYVLDMFPYPSGAGLHVGHPESYTANDIIARYFHAKGYNVLQPIGRDAFGLPAENYAIKTGTHPKITTEKNISNFKKQIKSLGIAYDWDREIDTTDPKYYKWTQWIFLKMFEHGLAYEQNLPINYCPSCKTGLANEEVLNDGTCERCGTKVEKKPIRQWVLAITKYADRLANDVDKLDWPEGIKEMQKKWIGRSEGTQFKMDVVKGKRSEESSEEVGREENNKKNEICISELFRVGHNGLANISSNKDDIQKIIKIKRKISFLGKMLINGKVYNENLGGYIRFNSKDLISHFSSKHKKEMFYRKNLLVTVFSLLNKIDFNKELIGYFIFKTKVIKIVLGRQENGIYFVKTYYKYDKLTELYKKLLSGNLEKIGEIEVYTTRIDTVFGMAYAVVAPDHKDVEKFIQEEQKESCKKYIEEAKHKSDLDRTADNKEKTGVFTGSYVINPYNGEKVPLWIADYVLGHYGTGAVMAVPAHDERDFAFAKKYGLKIVQSIAKYIIATGVNAPRKGKTEIKKEFINAIIEYQGKFLLLKEKIGCKFVGGGLEKNETPLEGIKREIKEESGFIDLGKISQVTNSAYYGYAYRNHKDINHNGFDYPFFHIKLNSLKQVKISEKEKKLHDLLWVNKNEVKDLLFSDGHKYPWECFLEEKAFTEYGRLVNSGEFTGLTSEEAKKILTEYAEKQGFGFKKVNYKLRDWLFSRQRYWGEPIPLIHLKDEDLDKLPHIKSLDEATDFNLAYVLERAENISEKAKCPHSGMVRELVIGGKVFSKIYDGIDGKIVCDYRLPLELPEMDNFEPAGDGQSPLAKVDDFVNVKLAENLTGKRETNTMPQWGGSCWYYLRYMDSNNSSELVNSKIEKYWGQVDSYVGGAEHAVLHLLYARFWHKFLYDIDVVSNDEPFYRLRNQGMILAHAFEKDNGGLVAVDMVEEKDGQYFHKETGEELKKVVAKMSKSLKNVVNPDDIVAEYGADALRLYEMYMADFKDSAPWDTKNILGVKRFLDKLYSKIIDDTQKISDNKISDDEKVRLLHKTIKKVSEDIEKYKFNTAISALMILLKNGVPQDEKKAKNWKETFIKLLHPFAPHIAEEIYQKYLDIENKKESIFFENWPKYDENLAKDDELTIAVQVMGKLRGTIKVPADISKDKLLEKAKNEPNVQKWIHGKTIVKEIYVPGKLVNLVAK